MRRREWLIVQDGEGMETNVIDVGANGKRVCDFLLVRNSNLGHILHRLGFEDFMCFWPQPYSTLILGVFPLHQIAHVGVSKRMGRGLFGREIIFRRIPTYVITVPKRYRQTDGRTDGQTTCNLITALCYRAR